MGLPTEPGNFVNARLVIPEVDMKFRYGEPRS
jgi:hypothetical protein